MKELFIKKYWDEEDILFYLHFQDGEAIRQIEISPAGKKYLSKENPVQDDSMLYDKEFEQDDFEENDFIKKEEFENIWNDK